MTAGTHIKDIEKRKIIRNKRDSCGHYQQKFGGCSVRHGLYCYKCKEWIKRTKSKTKKSVNVKDIDIPYLKKKLL